MRDEQKSKEQVIEELVALRESFSNIQKLAAQQEAAETALRQQTQRVQLMAEIAQRIRQSLNLEEILNTTVKEVQQFLQADRVFIYRFQADWSGVVIVESVDSSYASILGRKITDSFFADPSRRELYEQNRIQTIADIYTADLCPCHVDLLANLQIRANLVVPILQGKQLWGLLVANYCSKPRQWQQLEIDLLEQLATQLSIALQQSQLYEQTQRLFQKEQALNRVIQSIRNSLDLETIFSTATREITHLVQADRAEIMQYLPERQLWLNVMDYRQNPDLPDSLGLEISDVGNEITARLKRLEVFKIENARTCSDEINRNLGQIYRGAWLIVPLHFGSLVWGSLAVLRNKESLSWQEEEVELTLAVADQLAIAIQQSTLFEQLQTELKERQQVEAALQEKQHFIERIAETTPDIVYVHDLVEHRNIYINRQVVEILGYTSQEIQKMGEAVLPNLVHPHDIARINEHLQRFHTLKDGEVVEIEYRMRHANGEWRWLHSRETVFAQNADGIPLQILGAASDITERKRTETEIYFQAHLLSAVQQAIIATDLNGIIIYWNNFAQILYGWSADEVKGKNILEIILPETSQEQAAEIMSYLQRGESWSGEFLVRRRDGTIFPVLVTDSPIYDDEKTLIGIIGISTDITERKQALEALQESEARLRLALEAAHMSTWDWDILTNNVVYFNEDTPIYGLPANENLATYEAFLNAIHPEDRDRVATDVKNAIENHTEYETEFRVIWPDGQVHWLGDKGQVFYDETGKAVRMVGVSVDISEHKQAEAKIREQAALLDVTTNAIFVQDLENKIIFWNKSAEQIYGWKSEEALGKNVNELLYKDTLPQLQEALSQTQLTGQWYGELHQIAKQGQTIVVESRWSLVEQENPKSILIINTDITQKKQFEAQFQRAQRLESLGTLASGIAHELNNILTPMLLSAQLLQMRVTDEQNQLLLQMLENNTQRSADLVKQVLLFARGVEGKRELLEVNPLILEIQQLAQQTFPRNIKVETDLVPNLWSIYGDATQLHQVLLNLVINGRDAMPNGGSLSISATNFYVDETYAKMNLDADVGSYIVITVNDTGIGIPQEILDRIFEPFFTTKEIGKGSGLGLSTVLGIIKSYNGFINVTSNVGKGTKFQVFLKAVLTNQTESEEELEFPVGNGELILVVDDEAEIREITETMLLKYNYRVLTANDGIEAIALYVQNRQEISAVLVDMVMPAMDGLTTIRTLQQMNPLVKIIPSSGLLDNQQLVQASGIQTFLVKPYTVWQLLQVLNSLLN
jgi:PAS domain S-box-containing protein